MSTAEPRSATRLELALAFALACAASLCFADKPVHQDDWAYLRVADLLLRDPLHVFEQTTLYKGSSVDVASGVPHGPVWPLLVALTRAPLFGAHALLAAHALTALLHGLAGLALASLAPRVGARPLTAALLYAWSPIAWVLAGNVMTDVPMVAFLCAALALAARGCQTGSRSALVGAGVLAALAALTRYHGLAVFPLLALAGWVFGAGRLRSFLPLVIGLALVGAYFALTRAWLGRTDAERASSFLLVLARIDVLGCALACVAALGFTALPALPALALGARGAARSACALLGAAAGAWLTFGPAAERGSAAVGLNAWLLGASLIGGAAWLGLALGAALQRRIGVDLLLACWLGGFAIAAIVGVPFGCSRYALPALPALALCMARELHSARFPRLARVLPVAALVLQFLVGALAAEADRRAARVYPEYAAKAQALRRSAWSEGRTWIWGDIDFRWYLEEAGVGRVIASASNEPEAGDRLLKSAVCTSSPDDGSSGDYRLHPELVRRLRVSDEQIFRDRYPVRVHNAYAGAGLYHVDAGILPFAVSEADHDRIQVWEVQDGNALLEAFNGAEKESYAKRVSSRANLRVERYFAGVDEDQHLSLAFTFPGRVTWRDVEIPADGELVFELAEHARLVEYSEPGPGSIARVRVGAEVVFETQLDSRRRAADRGWRAFRVDLARHAGQRVALTFEVGAQPAPPGCPAEAAEYVLVGFGDPQLRSRP
ncbi:MAG: hypothetical protein FJ299_05220 [Planctomycetes bacterium]|nr:hypothetical protein [Planctomycetota bacterium]